MHEIKTSGLRLLDALGRERIFHGMNLKADDTGKAEFGKLKLLDEEFFRRSAALGFNVLRLGIHWESLEPEKGKLNEGLLRRVDEIFATAEKHGMYVFLDMHQDVYGGMPEWTRITDGIKWPKKTRFVWAEGYFWGRAVHRAFDNFWDNTPTQGKGLQDHFAELWQILARRYADSPAFFGFDLLNEPFPGKDGGKAFRKLVCKLVRVAAVSPTVNRIEFIRNAMGKQTRNRVLDVLTPEVLYKVTQGGAAEKLHNEFYNEKYSPFIAKMSEAIREITPKGLVFVEHSYFSNIAVPFTAKLPEGEAVCYSPHGYDFTVDTPAYAFANNARVKAIFDENLRAQRRLNVPVLVGEWGAGYMGEKCFPHIEFLADLFDAYNWSFAYFTYTEGMYDTAETEILVRPYPVAVNGEIKGYSYDSSTGTFTLEFTQPADADSSLPTEIYLPRAAESVEAEGFEWWEKEILPGVKWIVSPKEEGEAPREIMSTGRMLLLIGGGAGEHRIMVKLM